MAEEAGRNRLGRGLAALIGDVGEESAAVDRARGQRRVPIESLRPNPRNPRRQFDDGDLADLAQSVREKGIIQPILVRTLAGSRDQYEIVAGERRWRAAQQAQVRDVPILLLEVSDREALEIAIIENVQRADLNAIEEAMGYEALIDQFQYTQLDLSRVIGKSRAHVTNTLRLLKLPVSVREMVGGGSLSAGHARALLSCDDPEAVAHKVVEDGLSVRQVEALAQEKAESAGRVAKARQRGEKDADTRALEARLSEALGLVVSIEHRGSGGELRVRYKNLEQLDDVCQRLMR